MKENKEATVVFIKLNPVGISSCHVLPYEPDKYVELTVNSETDFLRVPGCTPLKFPKLEQLVIPENQQDLVLFEDSKIALRSSIFTFVVSDFSKQAIYQIGLKLQSWVEEVCIEASNNFSRHDEVFGYLHTCRTMGSIYNLQSDIAKALFVEMKRYLLSYWQIVKDGEKNKMAFFHYATNGETFACKTVEVKELENYKS